MVLPHLWPDIIGESGGRRKGIHARRISNGDVGMTLVVSGLVRGSSVEADFAIAPDGSQYMAPADAAYTELSRQGQGWSSMAVAAVAGLVVRPTTVAAFEIWNGSSTYSLVVDRIFTFNLVASAIQGTYTPWAMVTLAKAAPAAGASVTVNGNSGKTYNGGVICGLGTTVIDNGWHPWGTSPAFGLGTATPGGSMEAQVMGRLIVPPRCSLCLHTVSQTTAWTFQNGASWFEKVFPSGTPLL